MISSYYSDKLDSLKDIFATDRVEISEEGLMVDGRLYPIVGDVIVLLSPEEYPPFLRGDRNLDSARSTGSETMDREIQFTFGEEWKTFNRVLPEHRVEFDRYFDLVNLATLKNSRVCDLGCGIGRWSYWLADRCRELVLVDFSDAIFVARENLRTHPQVIYFLGDLTRLPFREGFADFLFCLGVLHHLPGDALEMTRKLGVYASRLLIYLYYALDNRPFYFRWLLNGVTVMRRILHTIHHPLARSFLTWLLTLTLYLPLVGLGHLLERFQRGKLVPLYEGYANKSVLRIRQDVYDRFFTSIEQRVTRAQILALQSHFDTITISDNMPYWHFLCESASRNEHEGTRR